MAIEQKKKEIDEITYIVTQMSAVRATMLQIKLIKLLGPSVSNMKTENIRGFVKEDGKPDTEKIISFIKPLLVNLDDNLVFDIIMMLFEKGVRYEIEGKDGTIASKVVEFDTHFSGNILSMWKVAFFILEVNLNLGKYIG